MSTHETNGRSVVNRETGVETARFDYSSVPASVAKFLKGHAERIQRQCVTSIIQIGKALLEAKRHLSHGEFLRWVELEAGIPVRTAQAYMRAASWASNKGAIVARLSPSVLYVLSASSTPENFVTDVLNRAEAGDNVAPAVMRKELRALRTRNQRDIGEARVVPEASSEDSMRGDVPRSRAKCAGQLAELVEILKRGLSGTEFSRVRDILMNDVVLDDPQLSQGLKRAFLGVGQLAKSDRLSCRDVDSAHHFQDGVSDSS